MKNKNTRPLKTAIFINSALLIFQTAIDSYSQLPSPVQPKPPAENNTWWYVTLFILVLGLIGAIGWWYNTKKAANSNLKNNPQQPQKNEAQKGEIHAIDSYKELEWLRSNRNNIDRKRKRKKKLSENLPHPDGVFGERKTVSEKTEQNGSASSENSSAFPPPIFNIQRLELARPFTPLPISNDEALLSAIEQTQDEYEEDEEVRSLAVRILAAFKKRNAVEALSQVALYDLSSNLRSKAVSILADFDHESVFETLLLACADPTREVRAAAARGLSRLSFDRTEAWLRIAETGESGRMKQAARAALEGGYVERIFDRLVHQDKKYAFEAVTLLALLIKADETASIFQKLENEENFQLQKAILHVIKITGNENALNGLYSMLEKKQVSNALRREIEETIEIVGLVPV